MSLVFGFPNFPLTGYAVPHKDFNEFMDSGEIESSHDSLLSGVNAHVSPSPFVTGFHGNILKARRQTKPVIREVLPRLTSAVEDPFVIEVQRFKDDEWEWNDLFQLNDARTGLRTYWSCHVAIRHTTMKNTSRALI